MTSRLSISSAVLPTAALLTGAPARVDAAPAAVPEDIERRQRLSYEEFEEAYMFANKPVIVTDAIRQWKALSRWTPWSQGELLFVRSQSLVAHHQNADAEDHTLSINTVNRSNWHELVNFVSMRRSPLVSIASRLPERFMPTPLAPLRLERGDLVQLARLRTAAAASAWPADFQGDRTHSLRQFYCISLTWR